VCVAFVFPCCQRIYKSLISRRTIITLGKKSATSPTEFLNFNVNRSGLTCEPEKRRYQRIRQPRAILKLIWTRQRFAGCARSREPVTLDRRLAQRGSTEVIPAPPPHPSSLSSEHHNQRLSSKYVDALSRTDINKGHATGLQKLRLAELKGPRKSLYT
jgi:hypothetical protein